MSTRCENVYKKIDKMISLVFCQESFIFLDFPWIKQRLPMVCNFLEKNKKNMIWRQKKFQFVDGSPPRRRCLPRRNIEQTRNRFPMPSFWCSLNVQDGIAAGWTPGGSVQWTTKSWLCMSWLSILFCQSAGGSSQLFYSANLPVALLMLFYGSHQQICRRRMFSSDWLDQATVNVRDD